MAAVLADKAGYWQLEVALAQVGAQLAAGVRPELLPLMQVGVGVCAGEGGGAAEGWVLCGGMTQIVAVCSLMALSSCVSTGQDTQHSFHGTTV